MYVAVAAIGGAAISGYYSSKSGEAQADAAGMAGALTAQQADKVRKLQKRQALRDRETMRPWLATGRKALRELSGRTLRGRELVKPFGMEDFEADPGYQFRLSEGIKAQERSAAARGGLLSGSQLKGLERFAQGLASQEYQSAFNRYNLQQQQKYNRLASLAGVGQQAAGSVQQSGQFATQGMGQSMMTGAGALSNAALAQGQARASAYQGYGQAAGQALGGAAYGAQQLWG